MHGKARHLVLVSAILTLCLISACSQKPLTKALPAPEVTIAQVVQKEVTKYLEYTGNTVPLQTVDIRARVPGFLDKMYFEPRAKVKAGQVLFLIDPRQYQANVKEAKARLESKKASSKLAQTEVQISQQLESKEAISALKLEKKIAERDVAGADVDLADADLDKAKLDLEWTHVASPIDGRVSRNKVDLGNLVGANEKTLLTTVVADDPIYAYFSVSELDLLPILRKMASKSGDPSMTPSIKLPIYLGLADETGYPHEGHFDFAETTVDSSTGTIQVRGIFPNPEGLLLGGMFVKVRVPSEKRTVMLIPDVAVQFDQGGRYVLTIDDSNVVQYKRIKMGEQVEDQRVVEEGLKPTDRVITTGVQRARPGSKVTVVTAASGTAGSSVPQKSKTK